MLEAAEIGISNSKSKESSSRGRVESEQIATPPIGKNYLSVNICALVVVNYVQQSKTVLQKVCIKQKQGSAVSKTVLKSPCAET